MRSFVSVPLLAAPVLTCLVLAAGSVSAQTLPSQGPTPTIAAPTGEVVLGDGNVLRGTITEIAQDDHVTVRLVTGQTALVKWAYLDRALDRGFIVATGPAGTNGVRVERALAATSSPNASPAAASTEPVGVADASAAARLPAMGSLRVRLVADRPVVLEKEIPGPDPQRLAAEEARDEEGEETAPRARRRRVSRQRSHWVVVCQAPCDRDMPRDGRYRITGEGVRNTSPFSLAGEYGGTTTITFDAASNAAFVGGLVVSGVGVLSLGVGALAFLALLLAESVDGSGADRVTLTTVGFGCLIGGGVTTIAGLGLALPNMRSSATQSNAKMFAPPDVTARHTTPTLAAAPTVGLWSTSF